MPVEIYTIQDNTLPDVQQLGGKGANLAKLAAQFPIPPFIIIPIAFFEGIDASNLPAKLQLLLPDIQAALTVDKLFAVRSSATIEDSSNYSFAGQFSTQLNVPFTHLEGAIKQVWQSGFSEVVNTYKHTAGITANHGMAVIVQQMIHATASGVAFGINPLNGNTDEQVINAIAGLGENLVSGNVNADAYTVADSTVTKNKMVASAPVLTDEQIMQVSDILNCLKSFFWPAAGH